MAGLSRFLSLSFLLPLLLSFSFYPSIPILLSVSLSHYSVIQPFPRGIQAGSEEGKYGSCADPEVTHHLFCYILLVAGPAQIQGKRKQTVF